MASTALRASSWAFPVKLGAGGVEEIIQIKAGRRNENAQLQKSSASVKELVTVSGNLIQ